MASTIWIPNMFRIRAPTVFCFVSAFRPQVCVWFQLYRHCFKWGTISLRVGSHFAKSSTNWITSLHPRSGKYSLQISIGRLLIMETNQQLISWQCKSQNWLLAFELALSVVEKLALLICFTSLKFAWFVLIHKQSIQVDIFGIPLCFNRLSWLLSYKRISWDLNNGLVQYSDHGHVFDHQMVCYSDHHINIKLKQH